MIAPSIENSNSSSQSFGQPNLLKQNSRHAQGRLEMVPIRIRGNGTEEEEIQKE
jgi:hypothetical protein